MGFPGARQGAMVEKESVDIATGEVSRERWYLLTSQAYRMSNGMTKIPRVT